MNKTYLHAATSILAVAAGFLLGARTTPAAPDAADTTDPLQRRGSVLPAAATQGMAAADAVRKHPAEIRLWPDAAPGSETQTTAEVVNWRTENDSVTKEPFSFPTVTNIHFPSITPYLPAKDKATGAAVIIAPGGGSMFLTINHEGYDLAKYFADHGVAAFVLKYRLMRSPNYPAGTYNLTHVSADGVRAMRLVRSRAAEFNINPDMIGTMGFSAGGDVVAQVHLHADEGNPAATDPVERVSAKPNFEAPVYTGSFRPIIPTKTSPPVFILCSYDDSAGVSGSNSPNAAPATPAPGGRGGGGAGMVDIYLNYKAAGVPAEIHIYNKGGHGFGGRDRPIAEARWMDNFIAWLNDRGLAKK